MSTRANYYQVNRPAIDALVAVSQHVTGIEPKLRALVELRVSQINGCTYCVDLHSTQARAHGETQQRSTACRCGKSATSLPRPSAPPSAGPKP